MDEKHVVKQALRALNAFRIMCWTVITFLWGGLAWLVISTLIYIIRG